MNCKYGQTVGDYMVCPKDCGCTTNSLATEKNRDVLLETIARFMFTAFVFAGIYFVTHL
jgi:hypothetical protein